MCSLHTKIPSVLEWSDVKDQPTDTQYTADTTSTRVFAVHMTTTNYNSWRNGTH